MAELNGFDSSVDEPDLVGNSAESAPADDSPPAPRPRNVTAQSQSHPSAMDRFPMSLTVLPHDSILDIKEAVEEAQTCQRTRVWSVQ